jgi:hypothetical protein
MNLLDTIRNNLATAAQPVAAQDNTLQARKLLGAKTGKASSQQAAPISSLQEASVQDQTRAGQQQLASESLIQQQQLGQQQQQLEQQDRLQKQDLELKTRAQSLQNTIQTDQLLNDLSRDKAGLNLERDRAKLEQLSHNIALQDKKYVDNLVQAANVEGLQDDIKFREALNRAAFQDSQNLLKANFREQAITAQSMRDLEESFARTRLADMLDMSRQGLKAEQRQVLYSGIGGAGAAAAGYGASKAMEPSGSSSSANPGPAVDTTRTPHA